MMICLTPILTVSEYGQCLFAKIYSNLLNLENFFKKSNEHIHLIKFFKHEINLRI